MIFARDCEGTEQLSTLDNREVAMITIIDYGVGNLFSLSSSLNYLGLENKVSGIRKI